MDTALLRVELMRAIPPSCTIFFRAVGWRLPELHLLVPAARCSYSYYFNTGTVSVSHGIQLLYYTNPLSSLLTSLPTAPNAAIHACCCCALAATDSHSRASNAAVPPLSAAHPSYA